MSHRDQNHGKQSPRTPEDGEQKPKIISHRGHRAAEKKLDQ